MSSASTGTRVKSYLIGSLLSLILTLFAYFLATKELLSGRSLTFTLAALGLLQVWVILFFFITLLRESKPHWNRMMFIFMIIVTVLVVFGSLWIMYHLNYNLMPNHQGGM